MNKKGKTKLSGGAIVVLLLFAIVMIGGLAFYGITYSAKGTVTTDDATATAKANSCDGVEDVSLMFNDIDGYKIGTDPASHLTIYEKEGAQWSLTLADDASSGNDVAVLSDYKGIIGNNAGTPSTTYFSRLWSGTTGCGIYTVGNEADEVLYLATAPSITVTNDDKQFNSDATYPESVANESIYTPKILVDSPSKACSAVYGAIIAVEYDNSYMGSWEAIGLSEFTGKFELAHANNGNSTADKFATFLWTDSDGRLCNGEEAEIKFQYETKTIPDGTTGIDVDFHWYPLNVDLNADTYKPIVDAAYDEDGNLISVAYTTQPYYVNKA